VTAVLEPGGGETIRPGFQIKVGRPELVLTESIYQPGFRGPDPHVHHDHVDCFFVLDGQLEWRVGPSLEPHTGGAGTFVLVPVDVLHTFRNPGPGEARFLNLHAPGVGFERYLRGDYPGFDQHYMPEGSGLPPDGVVLSDGERLEVEAPQLAVRRLSLAPGSAEPGRADDLDAYYVLEGELALSVGDEQLTAGPGSFAAVPPGGPHTLANPGSEPVRLLNVRA
jgi:mannose-6-phosphate isomerase-like protein (cupin superfamily)